MTTTLEPLAAAPPVSTASRLRPDRTLVRAGLLLFLLGLATGLCTPWFANTRMGLASHLQGLLNGLFLMVLAVLWPDLDLGPRVRRLGLGLALYGTFANWAATFAAAWWGAGAMMPIAGQGRHGSAAQEAAISGLLLSLTAAMLVLLLLCCRASWRRGAPIRG